MPQKLPIWDQRMLKLMDFLIDTKKVMTQGDFLQSIGMNKTAIYQVKAGTQSFRLEHLHTAGRKYGVNMNWFFGLDNDMFRGKKERSALVKLREAVLAVELEIKKN